MAEKITVSTEEMQQTLSVYSAQKGMQSAAFNNMKSAVTTLSSTWEGEAYNAFRQQFEMFYKNIQQSEEKMQDAVDELRKTSDLFLETENKAKTDAGGLDVGTSPFSS